MATLLSRLHPLLESATSEVPGTQVVWTSAWTCGAGKRLRREHSNASCQCSNTRL